MKTHILHAEKTVSLELNNAQRNAHDKTDTVKALCRSLPVETTTEELWLPLVALNNVTGIDGRSWVNTNPQAVIDNTKLPFILDIDHASEMSFNTESSGWFTALKVEDGHIQAKLELNSHGQALIDDKRYKFYSPAFLVNHETNNIMAFTSVGLTNKPNLDVPALNHFDNQKDTQPQEFTMLEELLAAMGLSADVDKKTALEALQLLKTQAQSKGTPDLNAYIPQATHHKIVAELNSANAKLKEQETAKHAEAVDIAINKALAEHKIAPADKEYFTSQCATAEGLAGFEKFTNSKPAIIGADTNLDNKQPSNDASGAELNSEQKSILAQMGVVTD